MSIESEEDGFHHLDFQERLHRLRELLVPPHPWNASEHVKRHLCYGLVRRVGMLEHSVLVLAALPSDGAPALALHEVEEVNVALNALFLNLRGSLDNAAWALTHHFGLVPTPNESDWRHRRFTQLFGDKFLGALEDFDPELADRLRSLKEWGRHLAAVRDPAAHRTPLNIPPSVVDEVGRDRIIELDEETTRAAEANDWDRYHSLQHERWNVGRFRWVLVLSEQEGLKLGSLVHTLNRDIGTCLDAIELVVRFTFAESTWTSARNCGPLPRRKVT